ncbi:flagellar hook-associated protein FlgK [Roseovarius sp. D22-M7]|uniref:flagellar hook-associated protein FlgK n=1 Tax=Roseovarius sp. D22-M7 TaxID=3127116 RepID=UPI00300F85D7
MSISGALSNALSGLTASSRMADIVSANVSNVLTDGYARRELALQSQRDGNGVSVAGVTRHVDNALLGDLRLADSAFAGSETRATFAKALERAIGTPGEPDSLAGKLTALESSLVAAAARPEETSRLQTVTQDADALAKSLNTISSRIETLRSAADADIARTVKSLDESLENVATLNDHIVTARASGRNTATLEDQRQRVVDAIAEIVPVRQLPRQNGKIALVTTGGALLFDGRGATLEFDEKPLVAAHMTQDNGLLSGIRINGQAVRTDANGPLAGGKLGALFDNRDRAGVEAQRSVDAIARDLVERLSDPGPDSTLTGGAPGLFTDAGDAVDPATETGLAGRIRLNDKVDPSDASTAFHIRDGLEALTPGPAGSADLLQRLSDALSAPRSIATGPGTRSSAGHVADMTGRIANARLSADQQVSFANSQATELRSLQLENGVDTDAEMQRLLLVEQAFSANARMIQTIDEMMQTLLRI